MAAQAYEPVKPLVISGSTTPQPSIEAVASLFTSETGIHLYIFGEGSETGLQNMRNGTTDVAMVSRPLSPEEHKEFASVVIGYDALAIIVNQRNPIEGLDFATLQQIYAAPIQNWNEIPAGDDRQLIVISKQLNRATLRIFEEYIGLKSLRPDMSTAEATTTIRADAWLGDSNGNITSWVGGIPGAIGYVSYGTALMHQKAGMPIKFIALDGVLPSFSAISNGQYPMRRELNLVYLPGNQRADQFAHWMLGQSGQMAITAEGFVSSVDTLLSAPEANRP